MSEITFERKTRSMRAPEFQAVILAGYGAGLQPLTNELSRGNSASPTPKALLPIGNKPMILYPLTWLQESAVNDVLVIAPASHKTALSEAIWHSEPSYPSFSSLSITLETLDDSEEASLGTADILRKYSHLFQTDVIVLPCDFIPPRSLTLASFLNDYRADTDRPVVKVLLYERGDPIKDGPSPSMYGIDKKTNTLVYVDEDFGDEDDLELRMSLLWKYPNMSLTTRYLDSHVYILKRSALTLLSEQPNLSSIKEDFLPWVCKLPYRKSYGRKWSPVFKLSPDIQTLALAHSTTPYTREIYTDTLDDAERLSGNNPIVAPRRNSVSRSVLNSHASEDSAFATTTTSLPDRVLSPLRCGVSFHHLKDGFAARANTIGAYAELNRQALAALASVLPPVEMKSSPTPGQAPPPQVSNDSLISSSTRLGERSSVKKSLLGPHCVIGKNVKISGCIIMDHVEVKDGAKLENTILSRNTLIGERGQLKDCELAPGCVTQPDVSLKGERLSVW